MNHQSHEASDSVYKILCTQLILRVAHSIHYMATLYVIPTRGTDDLRNGRREASTLSRRVKAKESLALTIILRIIVKQYALLSMQ